MRGILLISHGSRSLKTKKQIKALVKKLRSRLDTPIVEYAFLELASPSIPEGIKNCVKKGAKEVIVLLNFLNAGRHVNHDIPQIIRATKKNYPRIPIRLTNPVGQHERVVELFLDMIQSYS